MFNHQLRLIMVLKEWLHPIPTTAAPVTINNSCFNFDKNVLLSAIAITRLKTNAIVPKSTNFA